MKRVRASRASGMRRPDEAKRTGEEEEEERMNEWHKDERKSVCGRGMGKEERERIAEHRQLGFSVCCRAEFPKQLPRIYRGCTSAHTADAFAFAERVLEY